jgi:hypothetical protein
MLLRMHFVALFCAVVSSTAFAAAPPQLRNKHITVSTTLQINQRAPDGRAASPQIQTQHVVYVSAAGRAFVRATRSVNSLSGGRTTEVGPGQSASGNAETREMRFEGGKLVGSFASVSGAARAVVSFDSAYSSCNASVIFGKQGGAPIKWHGLDGVLYEVQSVGVAGQTCTIRDGNPFTN